jgi:DDE superfamily endonuclease
MVWGAFSTERQSELVFIPGDPESKHGRVMSIVYHEVLEDQLPTLWEPSLVFMQDNASIHTAKVITNWFKEQGIEVVKWPPISPDLNPIEYV